MNESLKAIVDELVDVEGAVVDAIGKKDFATVILPDLIKAVEQSVVMVPSLSDLKAEIAALATPANQADLEAYILSKIVGVSAKAQAIISAIIGVINAGEQLFIAIKS